MSLEGKVFVSGHRGLVGSAIVRRLSGQGHSGVVTRSHAELDLRDQALVQQFFEREHPRYVFHCAAKVGGIEANLQRPAEFIADNLMIQTAVIDAAYRGGVEKLLFLSSSAIYPRDCPQPMREEMLLTGPLEPSNEFYSVAKLAGIKLAQAYWRQYGFRAITALPTNLYGEGDHFDSATAHVLPSLIGRFHRAKLASEPAVSIWGSGRARREFLFVDDLADACLFLMERYDQPEPINVGFGEDIAIGDLARLIAETVGYQGRIEFDTTKPEGVLRKWLDSTRLAELGWRPSVGLAEGIRRTYDWFVSQPDHVSS